VTTRIAGDGLRVVRRVDRYLHSVSKNLTLTGKQPGVLNVGKCESDRDGRPVLPSNHWGEWRVAMVSDQIIQTNNYRLDISFIGSIEARTEPNVLICLGPEIGWSDDFDSRRISY
jgi:hypothetical protein